jgi:hypothetical protein
MTRNNADFHGYTHEVHEGNEVGEYTHVLKQHGNEVARANVFALPANESEEVQVDWLSSSDQGKGHGTELIQKLYDHYPNHVINFGLLAHPASEHLAEKFESKYPNRTLYSPNSYAPNKAKVNRLNERLNNLGEAKWGN